MELLKLGVVYAAAMSVACYEPELRDCTLTCSSEFDCADGHVCGSDHYCASPEVAGTCGTRAVDAGAVDGRPDELGYVPLAIEIDGKGRVTVHGIGTCNPPGPKKRYCVFVVPRASPLTADAVPDPGWRFARWTTKPCDGVPISTCTFTPHAPTTLGVKLHKGHE